MRFPVEYDWQVEMVTIYNNLKISSYSCLNEEKLVSDNFFETHKNAIREYIQRNEDLLFDENGVLAEPNLCVDFKFVRSESMIKSFLRK